MDYKVSFLHEKIFEFEAKRTFEEVKDYTCLNPVLSEFDSNKKTNAINYIVNVFKECYLLGDLKLIIESDGEKLKGYAFVFDFPNCIPNCTGIFLHSIFIVKKFRNQGVGTNIINKIKNLNFDIYLLSDDSKINFYKKIGFTVISKVSPPTRR